MTSALGMATVCPHLGQRVNFPACSSPARNNVPQGQRTSIMVSPLHSSPQASLRACGVRKPTPQARRLAWACSLDPNGFSRESKRTSEVLGLRKFFCRHSSLAKRLDLLVEQADEFLQELQV